CLPAVLRERRTARRNWGITRGSMPMWMTREAILVDICRIGLIGAGNVGRRHAEVLGSFPDVHLAGITDVVPAAAAALARDVGCRAFPGPGELLAAGVDAGYVCV